MFSPALRHRQQKLARRAAGAEAKQTKPGTAPAREPEDPAAAAYRELLVQRDEDLRQLHNIQSIENKREFKAKAIEKYLPWCQGALAIEDGAVAPQDDIVVTCLIWGLDIRCWPLVRDLATHVLKHGLQLPEQYHRGAAALVVSEMADVAIAEPGSVPHDVLIVAQAWVAPAFDMKDSYRARLHRALGESWARQAEAFSPDGDNAIAGGKPALVATALTEFRRALALDKNVGVKKQIEQLEREAKKLAEEAGHEEQAPADDPPAHE